MARDSGALVVRPKFSMSTFAPSQALRVLVGDNKREFCIAKDLICTHSYFFKAACNPLWESGQTNTVILAEDDPKLFSVFLTWIVTGNVEEAEEFPDPSSITDTTKDNGHFQDLARHFVLGDVLQAPGFCNIIMDKLIAHCKLMYDKFQVIAGSGERSVAYAFKNTTTGSPLRRLIVANYSSLCKVDEPIHIPYTLDFYYELSRKTLGVAKGGEKLMHVWLQDPCDYHKHLFRPEGYSCSDEAVRAQTGKLLKIEEK